MSNSINRREFLIASSITAGLGAVTMARADGKAAVVRIVDLKADHLSSPLGLQNPKPRLSWRLESTERNVRQSGYRIRVASTEAAIEEGRGDLWDSGKVQSSRSFSIAYEGRALRSRQRCWWRVEVWTTRGEAAASSAASWWEMGLLEPKDWTAQWLAAEDAVAAADREAGLHWIWGAPATSQTSRKFRLAFELPVASASSELYAVVNDWPTWVQINRIWIDGKPVWGQGTWVEFKRESLPDPASVSSVKLSLPPMSKGRHVIAAEVSGRPLLSFLTKPPQEVPHATYAPAFAALVRLNLQNGQTERLITGPRWKTSLAQDEGWHRPDFDDTAWPAADASPAAQGVTIEGFQPWPAQPAVQLRRAFVTKMPISQARLYVTALGSYEARLNGRRVGDALLTPEASQFDKRLLYRVHDVTESVRSGDNVLGLIIGDGWYAGYDGRFSWGPPPRRALAQLELMYADGSREVIGTGPGWRMAQSPIQASELKSGEIYDARLEQPDWDAPGFNDARWVKASIGQAPSCRLTSQVSPPIRAVQALKPAAIKQTASGVYLIDFGQHFSGRPRLRTRGARGARIELRCAEKLTASGDIDQSISWDPRGAGQCDVYILKGDPSGEIFEPRFSYRSFRYLEIRGLQTAPTVDDLTGVFIHSDLPVVGKLRSDSVLVEKIWESIVQTQKSNFVGIFTDNAVREYRPYLNDSSGDFWDTAAYNMDLSAFTARQMENIADKQAADGAFPILAPYPQYGNAFHNPKGAAPGWGDGGIILPWTSWQHYGDLGIIERHWEAMNRHVQFVLDRNPDFLWKNNRGHDYGDWLSTDASWSHPDPTPRDLIATAYWAHSTSLLAQMSQAIDRTQDAARLRELFANIRRAFNERFLTEDGVIGDGSQTAYVLALAFNLLPEHMRSQAAQRLADAIRGNGGALTTGTLATQFALEALANSGFERLAYDLLLRTEIPSWGYMVQQGANTIWETWDGNGGSRNQFALAGIGGFLFRRLAGIAAEEPGFKKIRIAPALDPRIKRGGGDYDSVLGRISTDWAQLPGEPFALNVTIPASAVAHIHLPLTASSRIEEGGRPLSRHREIRMVRSRDGEAVIEVGSGTYRFLVYERGNITKAPSLRSS